MSIAAYGRAMVRELVAWIPFTQSFPFDETQTSDRNIIYGLYSGAYINGQKYLTEIEAMELSNLLNDYNTKMAELTTNEQVVVADIVSKRYLAGIDKAIHDQKMSTRGLEIQTDDDLMSAKIAALAADYSALDTLDTKLSVEIVKNQAKITELESYIAIEGFQLSEVDVQIAEKNIQVAEIEIKKLEAANAVLKIQIDTVEAAVQLVDIDLQIARTLASIADTNKSIANIGLLANELTVAQANTLIAQAELPIAAARVLLAQAKSTEVDKELVFVQSTQVSQANTDYQNKLNAMNLKHLMRETSLTQNKAEKELSFNNRLAESKLLVTFAGLDSTEQVKVDVEKVHTIDYSVANFKLKSDAAIEVAGILAAAKIATELTHTVIKKA